MYSHSAFDGVTGVQRKLDLVDQVGAERFFVLLFSSFV